MKSSHTLSIPELPTVTRNELTLAVRRLVKVQAGDAGLPEGSSARLPDYDDLHAAAISFADSGDGEAVGRFRAILETTYLVAAVDDVTPEEKATLTELVSAATGSDLDLAQLSPLFDAYDRRLSERGRAAVLAELAEGFGDFMAREEALNFAALMAMADGSFGRKEARLLIEMAEAFGFSVGELQLALNGIGASLEQALTQG